MNKSDYDKYYKKGGTYVIPVEIFDELFYELERQVSNYEQALEYLDKKENIIKEVREYIENNKQYAELEDYGKNGEYYIDEIGLLEILDKEVN